MNLVIREKDKLIVGITLFVIIVVSDLVMGLGWQYRLLSDYGEKVNTRTLGIRILENDIKNLDRNKEETADLDEKIDNLKLLITDERDISVLIENISNSADSTGVKIIQVKPATDVSNLRTVETKDGKFGEIEIQIMGKSDFHQLGNFVSKIESVKGFFKISSLEIEGDSKDYFTQNILLSLRTVVNLEE